MPTEYKDKISDDDKKVIEDAVKDAKEVLAKENADKDDLEKAVKELSEKIMPIGAKLYQQEAPKGNDSNDDEPAEGEVVDEKK